MAELHWTAHLAAFLTPAIAIAVAWIGFQQWRTASDKVRLELFEKRFSVYQAVVDVMGQQSATARVKLGDIFSYRTGVMQAEWLFGNEVWKYLHDDFDAMLVKHQQLDEELAEHQRLHPQFHDDDIKRERTRIVDAH